MISHKLSMMRFRLQALGLSHRDADEYVDRASASINEQINSLVSNAVEEAASRGSGKNAEEFLSQIKLDSNSGYIQITTDSGSLDFSAPATPMLPWLLKGAKTAKDGSQYKIIPVGANNSNKPQKPIKNISQGLDAMRSASYQKSTDMASQLAAAFAGGSSQTIVRPPAPRTSDTVNFRVASSKQDSNSKWVMPAREMDLTADIAEINSRLRLQIDTICDEVIESYTQEAEDYVHNA